MCSSSSCYVNTATSALGYDLFDYQRAAAEDVRLQAEAETAPRLCLYYRTGAGKTATALLCLYALGEADALIVAPPSTHDSWAEMAQKLGILATVVSHAKFRMRTFKLSRSTPIIVDEFHQLGGVKADGWQKLDKAAKALKKAVIICSATPNYNDAERCYCVEKIIDPVSVKGGYLEFLYTNCDTAQNPFGATPLVQGFRYFESSVEYLTSLSQVHVVPDTVSYSISDYAVYEHLDQAFSRYGLSIYEDRLMASSIEKRHMVDRMNAMGYSTKFLRSEVLDALFQLTEKSTTPVLLFANSAKIATAAYESLKQSAMGVGLITGSTSKKNKLRILDEFRTGGMSVLVGTASLATGTDGLDQVCDHLIILDDTNDNSLRRQLIGRILPRGLDTDASNKVIDRIIYT